MKDSEKNWSAPRADEAGLFDAALEYPPGERRAFLDAACRGDATLRERVEALLAAHATPVSLPEPEGRKAGAAVKTLKLEMVPDEAVGTLLGRYKLLERVGEGGCGVVYVAEQTEPVRRRVALKVIKLGMDTKQVVARFEAERQALAMMDHPNIAKVLDAGTTETGRPYFVMELVRGIRITDYCDQAQLPTQARLDLFIKVCHAIQHAHQKGIIHRDIKPSNILVTLHDGVPVPKVIDFGIAKATDGRLTEHTVYTQLHQFIGTPAYMSPEQAEMSGLDIDTRSDIYSLGVLLYELLAGSTPFDAKELMASGIDIMRQIIREQEPVRPSTKLATLEGQDLTTTAKRRAVETSRLANLLRGDLDWIVMKCLEKDRARRYETANGLAADLKRHMENEPVLARPPSTAYRFQKAFRRHKFAFAAAGMVVAVLVLGVIGTTLGFMRAEKQRHVAEAARRQAQASFDQARGAVSDLLAVSDNDLYDVSGMLPLRIKLMKTAIDRYKPFLEQPGADVGPRAELARLYAKYGFASDRAGQDAAKVSFPAYQAAFAIQEQLLREHPQDRMIRSDLGWTYLLSVWEADRKAAKTQQVFVQAAAIFEGLTREDPADPFSRADLAWMLAMRTWDISIPNVEGIMKRSLELREQLVREFPQSAEFRRDLATSVQAYGANFEPDPKVGLAMIARASAMRESLLADMGQHLPVIWLPARPQDAEGLGLRPSTVWMKRDLAKGYLSAAKVHARIKQWPEAVAMLDRSLAIYQPLAEQNPTIKQFKMELEETAQVRKTVTEQAGAATATP